MKILTKLLRNIEIRHRQRLAEAYTTLKTQNIVKEITMLFFTGLNLLHNMFRYKIKSNFDHFNLYSKLRHETKKLTVYHTENLNNTVKKISEEDIQKNKQKLKKQFYLKITTTAINSPFQKLTRWAF